MNNEKTKNTLVQQHKMLLTIGVKQVFLLFKSL
jgi:hypothetical protein